MAIQLLIKTNFDYKLEKKSFWNLKLIYVKCDLVSTISILSTKILNQKQSISVCLILRQISSCILTLFINKLKFELPMYLVSDKNRASKSILYSFNFYGKFV